ncbi:MAG: acyl-CoA carboxylase subunit epsilon [Longispora sp.]|nr:acyl-CoA carboxylase subunit epsilon [Longispora sp. (in: high G+C Gram-positive bacteria)]
MSDAFTVTGSPTPEELAALIVVLSSRGGYAAPEPPAGFSPWRASALPAAAGLPVVSRNGWRSSTLPR